jgi:hypothetical protein
MDESKSIMSLNQVRNDFASEDLEPRLEMQLLGLGCDPRIVKHFNSKGQTTAITTFNYYSVNGALTKKR